VQVKLVSTIIQKIDAINEWMGKIFGLLLIPLVFITVAEVILRYIFNNPTIWGWDVNIQILGAIVVLGGGYALLYNTHVSVDLFVSKLPPQKKALLDIITSPILIGALALLLWRTTIEAWHSVLIGEEYTSTWGPPIYPLKIAMVVGIGAMILQGIAHLMRNLLIVVRRRKGG